MATGLIRRNGRYSTRRVIPLDLQAHYGRRELVRALGTADPLEARTQHARMWVALNDEFQAARKKLTAEAALPAASQGPRRPDPWETISDEQFAHEMEQLELRNDDIASDEHEFESREGLRRQLEARLLDPKADLSPEQSALRDIVQASAYRAAVAEEQAAIARSGAKRPNLHVQASDAAPSRAAVTTGLSLSGVVDRWAAENQPKARTVTRTRNIIDRFEAVNGKLAVQDVTKHHVLAFKDALVAQGQSPANINVMIPMLGTVFNYAADKLHLIQISPAAKIRVTDKRKAKDKRRGFEVHELNAIMASPVYADGLRPAAGGGEAAYWLPLLALYTGARQTELGQLHPEDIVEETYSDADGQEHAAWVMRIVENPDRGQFVKNEGSERRVPIHADLVALGFLRFATAAKLAGRSRLFDKIVPNSVGELMGNWSKWFGRYRRVECGLTGKDTPFHSFRHSFKQFARLSLIPNDVHNEFTGHETGDVADAYGGLSYPLAPLVDAMGKYRVPGFKLPASPPGLAT